MESTSESKGTTYQLSGGGSVTVYKPFGATHYVATVEQRGPYPEPGSIATNKGRKEFSVILEGKFTYRVNGVARELTAGMSVLVPDGARYSIEGSGKVLVFVEDAEGGATIITPVKNQD